MTHYRLDSRQYPYHRGIDEIMRQVLNYLYKHGPTAVTQLEYAIEINNGLMKKIGKDLVAANMVYFSSPGQLNLSPKQKVKLNDNVLRVLCITEQGIRCMKLMNKRALLLESSGQVG